VSLYEELCAAGIETEHHFSDLYFPINAAATEILKRHPIHARNARKFMHGVHRELWYYDVPFAFTPYWESKIKEGEKQ
jgi:hypothetical protein